MTGLTGINFHGVGTPDRTLEPGEAPYWLSISQFHDVLDQIAGASDSTCFTLTFDDSNLSDHDIALPALVARGLRAQFFILTGRIGQRGSLDTSHIKALSEAGMTIGSHGINHVAWPRLSDAELEQELRLSRTRLEDICGHPVTEAGIPFGRYDARVLRALHAAGYTAAWSSDGGKYRPQAFLRPRTSLRGDMTNPGIRAVLDGQMARSQQLRRMVGMLRRRWLVTG
ncbi:MULTISPECIES: polysaccharide deacetylase family protein [unclassified Ruegeria]|uniref:polysaccharide deacetylase family protein n=1 Tax=unclassified Ruegeria TaxID=2625375 RepID=UPI001487903E|nr:polysaccharide deacetylase family protein [Ruegeria sp. HKCCD6109]